MSTAESATLNRQSFKNSLLKASKDNVILIVLFISLIIFSLTSEYFLTSKNLLNILLQSSTIAIVAIGQAFVMLSGNLDLSLGQSVCLSGYVAAIMMKSMNVDPWISLIACLACTCLVGLINGILVAYVNIPSFIATLGTMNICTGAAKLVSNSATLAPLPKQISFIGRGFILDVIPMSVVIMLFLYLVASFLAKKTKTGRYIYSIGGNKEAAFFSGIKVKKFTLVSYLIAGLCAGLGSIVLLSRLDAATISNGKAYEFDAVIGCVLGGISLSGGKGAIIKAFYGVLFLSVFFNGMTQLNVNPFVQDVIKGIVLISAIAFDVIRNRVKN